MFSIIGQAEHKQGKNTEQYNKELVDFAKKAGCVYRNRLAEPIEIAGSGEKFHYCHSGDDKDYQCDKDCDAAAQRDGCLMVSVGCRLRNEADTAGQLFYDGC